MHLTGLVARIAYALLVAIVTFVVLLIIGAVVNSFDANIGSIIQKWAAVIALLVGLVTFFTRNPGSPIV